MIARIATVVLSLFCMLSSVAHAGPAIAPFEADSLDKIVSTHKGRAFVLLVWSLDCVFCKASMAELARHQRKGQRLNLVTVATDSVSDAATRAQLADRLGTAGLTSINWAFGDAPAEQLRYVLDPKWHGELPRSYWYNAKGKRTAYSGAITAQVIAKLSVASLGK